MSDDGGPPEQPCRRSGALAGAAGEAAEAGHTDEDATRTRAANSNPSLTASGERRLRFHPGARVGPYVIDRTLGEGDVLPPPKYAQYDHVDEMADAGFRVAHSVASDRGHFFRWE